MRNFYHPSHKPDVRIESAIKHVPEFNRIKNLEQNNERYIRQLRKKIKYIQILGKKIISRDVEIRKLEDRIIKLLEIVGLCRDQFQFYKRAHWVNQSFVKATINKDFEKMCQKIIEECRGRFGE